MNILPLVIRELRQCDWSYQRTWPLLPGATLAALQQFWANPARHPIADALGCPHDDWHGIVDCLASLGLGRPVPATVEGWRHYSSALADLEGADPMAAAIAAMYAVAAWEGTWPGHPQVIAPGFGRFVLPLARALVASDALWATELLIELALREIKEFPTREMSELIPVIYDFQTVRAELDRRYGEYVNELAWDLRSGCAADPPSYRAEVAALAWTLGDPWHAEAISAGRLPPLSVIRRITHDGLRNLRHDVLVPFLWLAVVQSYPHLLERHHHLLTGLNAATLHEDPNDQLARSKELLACGWGFARVAIEYFEGEVTAKASEYFNAAYIAFSFLTAEHLAVDDPPSAAAFGRYARALIRTGCLMALTTAQDPDPAHSLFSWCRIATRHLGTMARLGIQDDYDLALDLPIAYLDTEAAQGHRQLLHLERHRSAGLWYSLISNSPACVPDEDHLQWMELQLRLELPALRFAQLRHRLKALYRGLEQQVYLPGDEDADFGLSNIDPVDLFKRLALDPEHGPGLLQDAEGLVDIKAVSARIAEIGRDLRTLARRGDRTNAPFLDHPATLDIFGQWLGPPGWHK